MVMREWNIHGYDEDETSRNSLLRASQFFQGACFFLGGGGFSGKDHFVRSW